MENRKIIESAILFGTTSLVSYMMFKKYIEFIEGKSKGKNISYPTRDVLQDLNIDGKQATITKYAKHSGIPAHQVFHQYYSALPKTENSRCTATTVYKEVVFPHLYVKNEDFNMNSLTLRDMGHHGWNAECVTDVVRYPTITRKEFILRHPFIPGMITVYCQEGKVKEVVLDAIDSRDEDFSSFSFNKHLKIGMSEWEVLRYFKNLCEPFDIVESQNDGHKLLSYRIENVIYTFNIDTAKKVRYISVSFD